MVEITKASDNLFEDLGFDKEEAANLLVRTDLMLDLSRLIKDKGLKQKEAAELMGVQQSLISDLVRGKIGRFTIDKLVNMAARAGIKINFIFDAAA